LYCIVTGIVLCSYCIVLLLLFCCIVTYIVLYCCYFCVVLLRLLYCIVTGIVLYSYCIVFYCYCYCIVTVLYRIVTVIYCIALSLLSPSIQSFSTGQSQHNARQPDPLYQPVYEPCTLQVWLTSVWSVRVSARTLRGCDTTRFRPLLHGSGGIL
jgi:hypothetical protein